MIGSIRSEWIKFRTVRANVILIAITVAAPLLLSILIASIASFDTLGDPRDAFGTSVVAPSMIAVYLCGVLGVLGIGQEYRHNTIRVTFAGQPRRSRVLAAKAIVYGLFGLFVGILTPTLCLIASSIIVRGRHLAYSAHGASLVGLAVFCLCTSLLGFGLGSIMRQPAGAIPLFLIWPLIVEGIVAAIFNSVNKSLVKWLPFQSAQKLVDFGRFESVPHFSRVVSGLYFGGWTVVVVAIGWWLVERRDA